MTDHAQRAREMTPTELKARRIANELIGQTGAEKERIIAAALDQAAQEAVQELKGNLLYDAAALRGVERDELCSDCNGMGVKSYSSTATWRGGVGGQAITSAVCDKCWGSGNKYRAWTNLRTLKQPNHQDAQPVWTKDTPTVAGWYWFRGSKNLPAGVYQLTEADIRTEDYSWSGEWVGPLPLPREA